MAITPETLRIIDDARNDVQRITDQHVLSLVGAWVAVWDDLAPEFETSLIDLMIDAQDGYIRRAAASRHVRLAKTLDLARQRILDLSDSLEAVVAADLPDVTRRAYASQASAIGSQLPPVMAVIRLSPDFASAETLDHIVKRSLEQIHKDSRPLADDVVRVMKKELIRGIAVGDNPRRTAGRIVKQTEGRFNGGLTRAMVIARNEVLDSHRAAAKVADEQSADLMAGWRWGSSLSARTCPSCLANHGTLHPISEPGPIDHHQGRCARIPVTKSWAGLGFPDLEEPADSLPDAQEWFSNLTPETQTQIMSKERLELLNAGKINWGDLTMRTTNGQWRDSMIVTPVKDLNARGGQGARNRR
jgi:hypothetical protein